MDACQYPGFERVAGGEDALLNFTTDSETDICANMYGNLKNSIHLPVQVAADALKPASEK